MILMHKKTKQRKRTKRDFSLSAFILDTNGEIVLEYTYNARGVHTFTENEDLANINPYRYRGYYYDTETGLYFLKTRYYDHVSLMVTKTNSL